MSVLPRPTLTAAVEATGVSKRYRHQTVLDGVDLQVDRGVTGLLGPNGAGKTTLLRIISTVLRPDAGDVRIFGLDPADDRQRHDIRCRLGYQPQEPGFFQSFSVLAFLDYVAILKELTDRTERRAEVRRVVDLVDLGSVAHKKIRRLSGGMRRRVALAQALLRDPELVVLDEPTAGIDPEQRLRFREVVSQVAARHSVLLSTHHTEDVAALCDRVVVLHQGRVGFEGSPAQLAAVADGRVWSADQPGTGAALSWRTGDGRHRVVGDRPAGGEAVAPTIEDGYLLLVRQGNERRADRP